MSEQRTKDQQSSIDRLPEDIREQLQSLLRDPRVTQLEATARINAILDETDHPERLSKSSVNRYKLRMDKIGTRLKESREMAQMWIAKLGAAPQGQVGHLVNEILRTLSFDMALVLQEGQLDGDNAPAVVDMLKGLALTMQRLEKASSENVKREEQIRTQEREAAKKNAVDTLSHIADAKTIKEFRKRFL
jgi:hypothetical protein